MRYGEFLDKNGVIGFVAPSFGCNIEPYQSAFKNALATFEKKGYHTLQGPNCTKGCGVGISNTPEACGEELTSYYLSDNNDVLISCGGGELMCEVLDYVDFDKIKSGTPKWFMGFSDNTNMTFLSATLCDTASIYGPCAPAFGMEPWHASLTDAFSILTGSAMSADREITIRNYGLWEKDSLKDEDHPLVPYNVTEPDVLHYYNPNGCESSSVSMHGRLIGGCMDCLSMLAGTKFDKVSDFSERYKEDGIIWYLEACDLNVMSIRRVLWQLSHAGWFHHVRGFLIGRPLHHGETFLGLDQYEAVLGILREYQVPVIMDADIGHIPPMMPLICGSLADICATENELQITMKLV